MISDTAKVTGLLTEYTVKPKGLDCDKIRFSWRLENTGAMQCGYRLTVFGNKGVVVWNSGNINSQCSVGVVCKNIELKPRTEYKWRVRVFLDDNTEIVSGDTSFETGLASEGFGEAKWILQNGGKNETSAPLFRKSFFINKKVAKARLYATCAGVYDAYLNGQPVSDSILNPGRNEYNKHIMYQTFDVTGLIVKGENAIGAALGRGWYIGACSSYGGIYPSLLAKLIVTFADGSEQIVVTDKSWNYCADGPVTFNDIFDGESYDARKEKQGWCSAEYNCAEWLVPAETTAENLGIGEVISQLSGVVKPMLTLPAQTVTEPEKGVYIYDFAQNLTGVVKVKLRGSEGTTAVLRHGEFLNDADEGSRGCDGKKGTLYTTNLRSAKCTDKYTFRGDKDGETYMPRFTYHGFRYVEITGVDAAPSLDEVTAVVLYSEMTDTAKIETSDAFINRLCQNALWGQRGNFLSVPTDCPQRDERMGWSGDAQIFAGTACYSANAALFYEKYLLDLNDCQHDNGAYPDVAPGTGRHCYGGSGNGGWADAGIVIPWVLYRRFNDLRPVADNYDSMCRYIDFLVKKAGNSWFNEGSAYGDWLSIGETSPKGVTDTAYSVYSCRLMSELALAVGKTADSERFSQYADSFAEAWCRECLNDDFSTKCNTQTSYVLGLHFGIIPQRGRAVAAEKLVKRIEENGNRISTGFLGASYILPVLCDYGYEKVAYTLLEQKAYPSWLYPVLQGATTIWERWNSYTIDDGFGDAGMNSFNHYAYGSVLEWMYKYVAGIRCSADGVAFKRIELHPVIGGNLDYVNAEFDSIYGKIKSSWRHTTNGVVYRCTVPSNTTAELFLPDSTKTVLQAGEYEFTFAD